MIELIKVILCGEGEDKKVFIQYNEDDEPQAPKIYTWTEYQDLNVEPELKNKVREYLDPAN